MNKKFNFRRKKLNLRSYNKTIFVFAILLALATAVTWADILGFINIPSKLDSFLVIFTTIFFSFLFASVFLRLTAKGVTASVKDLPVEQRLLLTKAYAFLVYTIAIFVILSSIGVTIQNLTLIAGMIATGLAFALREVLVNYLVWFMILTKKPFRIGDNIQINETEGKVIHIGMFYAVLDDSPVEEKDYVRIPNKLFLEHPINNYGKEPFKIKMFYPLKEANSKKIEKLEEELKEEFTENIKLDLEGDSGTMKLVISYKVNSFEHRDRLRTSINKKLIDIFPFKS